MINSHSGSNSKPEVKGNYLFHSDLAGVIGIAEEALRIFFQKFSIFSGVSHPRITQCSMVEQESQGDNHER